MKTYKAFGQKIINYSAEIQADDPIEAWNKADGLYAEEWQQEDTDEIATTEVLEVDSE